ncbi:GNAT family N-acetyltransferase [Mycobacterium bohemicum]|uniref:N-acetyltransferase domain-containing protein n=1 Tax=Mycobacterium bohemicum TaxID=56425 RepID=A0A1X1R502_MYCBE|nr:GNAT family N-acetyltransferase [Mycobacterium bohemicum]MCV6968120.1 GNAT family N-acetyltransferase [Mycobacterium bohemicum]ORU99427.1 hypothetical protein AWB93_11185 [Mycobacterium bohemicum]
MSDQAVQPVGESVTTARLLDGRLATMRFLREDDADAVYALHDQLSDHDRYFRFFTLRPVGLREVVGALTGQADGVCAVGAFDSGRLIGVAHYTVGGADPETAEVAVLVAHDDHSRGVGTALLNRLTEIARSHGVRRFVAEVLGENHLMLTVFSELGWRCSPTGECSVRHLEFQLCEQDS